MAKFCRICGSPLADDDNFCERCGTPVVAAPASPSQNDPNTQNTQNNSNPATVNRTLSNASTFGTRRNNSPSSNTPVPGRFMGNTYGNTEQNRTVSAVPTRTAPKMSGEYNPTNSGFNSNINPSYVNMQEVSSDALSSAGEAILGGFTTGTSVHSAAMQALPVRIPGKIGALLGGIDVLFGGIKNSFKHPKALLSSAAMFAAWMWLKHIDDTGQSTELTDIISRLIYKNGLDRHGFAAFRSMFGMGTVAAAFSTLFHGGIKSAFSGIGRMFSDGFSFGSVLMGAGFSMICYKLFTDGSSDGTAVAAGIVFMALQAVTRSSGFLFNISASHSKMRSPTTGQDLIIKSRYGSYLAGMAAGAAAAGILAFRFEYSYIIPLGMILLGSIINGIFKPRITEGAAL